MQLATPDSHRGRVSAVEHIIGASGPDLGNFRGGLVAGATSASFAAVSGGALCVLGVAGLAVANTSLRRFTTSDRPPTSSPDDTPTEIRDFRVKPCHGRGSTNTTGGHR